MTFLKVLTTTRSKSSMTFVQSTTSSVHPYFIFIDWSEKLGHLEIEFLNLIISIGISSRCKNRFREKSGSKFLSKNHIPIFHADEICTNLGNMLLVANASNVIDSFPTLLFSDYITVKKGGRVASSHVMILSWAMGLELADV